MNLSPETSILQDLKTLQSIQEKAFPRLSGLFPSARSMSWGYKREDDSGYFTATLLESLLRLEHRLLPEEKSVLESIRSRACEGFPPFQNKQGLPRYNFWKTNPGRHFPNGYLLGRWDRFRPPDDVDDSVMYYLVQKRSREEAIWLMEHIDSYANGKRKWVRDVDPEYAKLGAWCTFFCKDMPLGFDACVLANVLYFQHRYQLPETEASRASRQYLEHMLRQRDHVFRPRHVAPYYPHTSIILYHLSRLLEFYPLPELATFRADLLHDTAACLHQPLLKAERNMLEATWLALGGRCEEIPQGPEKQGRFAFFVLPMTLEYNGTWAKALARQSWTHIRFHCPSLELGFALEKAIRIRGLS